MKQVKVVIGSNFGDEGKGLVTNAFCKDLINQGHMVLNIRFNGTCQSGHTVEDGNKKHVFQHFGAGSFNPDVATYLSSYFYINPIYFNMEYDSLVEEFGIAPTVVISSKAPLVLYYDMAYNRLIESSRGNNRHGSCGYGLFEAVLRDRANKTVRVDQLDSGYTRLYNTIKDIRDNYYKDKIVSNNIQYDSNVIKEERWLDNDLIDKYIENCRLMLERVQLSNDWEVYNHFRSRAVIFEGGQGLQLDWMNREYMPYITASRTGLHNVASLIKFIDSPEIEVCYVTRSYTTKHGAGHFNFEVDDKKLLGNIKDDATNQQNRWQGNFRYGYFDIDRFSKAIKNDLFELYDQRYKKSICITHLNETESKIVLPDKRIDIPTFYKAIYDIHPENDGGKDWELYGSWDTVNMQSINLE